MWRWMTYRVGVRLFITYLLIGVLPLLFAASFAAVGLYIAMGQYTSVRLGSEFEHLDWTLDDDCEDVLGIAAAKGAGAALSFLDDLAGDPPYPLSRVVWWAKIGDQTRVIGGGLEGLMRLGQDL